MQSKIELKGFEPLALACKALSHPARLAILQTLALRGICICGEVDGPRSCYCIDESTVRELREQPGQLFSSLESCC